MKFKNIKISIIPKLLLSSTLLLLTLVSISLRNNSPLISTSFTRTKKECNIFEGKWIADPNAIYYTNTTCWMIQEHQNCMKYGRPDVNFLKWRWKPNGCDLPRFEAALFLEILKGKSLAFVGDSLARNQMQSLMCLLSKVAYPEDVSATHDENFKDMFYPTHNFTVSIFWSPFLVKYDEPNDQSGLYNLYLDEAEDTWLTKIHSYDYVIVSGGNWFTRPSMFYQNRTLIGCHYCQISSVADLNAGYSNRRAFRTAFAAIRELEGFEGAAMLRSLSPDHFEDGEWNRGGNCVRTMPLEEDEARLADAGLELYGAQIEEFRVSDLRRGFVFDVTRAMVSRADGHPSRYGHWADENVTLYNDCVHWCLPGPVDLLHFVQADND